MSIVGKLQAMHNLGHFREVCVDHVRFDALRQELIDVSVRYMLTLTHGEQFYIAILLTKESRSKASRFSR